VGINKGKKYKKIKEVVEDIVNEMNFSNAETNEEFNRSKKYTSLLEKYVTNAEKSLGLKLILKTIFFFGIILILLALIISFITITIYSVKNINVLSTDDRIMLILPFVSSLSTTLVALCKLPEIIAQYLFNPEEEKSIIEIIGKMQVYDLERGKRPYDKNMSLMLNVFEDYDKTDPSMKKESNKGNDDFSTSERIDNGKYIDCNADKKGDNKNGVVNKK
jgi:hypothetical protein